MSDQKLPNRYQLQTAIFKALAHPMRLFMLEMLRDKDWCVCELAAAVGVSKSVASKHLSQLKAVGLIEDSKRGTQVEYHLLTPCILEMAACAERSMLDALRRKLDLG